VATREPTTVWQIIEVKLPQLPLNNSTYVVAAVRFVPKPFTVIVALGEVAVKVNQTSFVGVVAPKQIALGEPVLVAASRFPVTEEAAQVIAGWRPTAFKQLSFAACEKTIAGTKTNIRMPM
jgi:hypothetical protein